MFHLAFILDKEGYNSINLVSFDSLIKLDDFIIKRFKNSHDVRDKYNDIIGEFCLDNMEYIKEENIRNKRNWTGSIVIICEERDNRDEIESFHKISVLYQNSKKLLSRDECLKKIKKELDNSKIINEILSRKRFLLSRNEIDLLLLDKNRGDDKYKKSFIGNFMTRIKNLDDDLLYYYCRSLMNICHLTSNSIETTFGKIDNIDYDMPIDTTLQDKPEAYSNDVYFNTLIEENKDEELFNFYDLDEIEKYSNRIKKGKK